MLDCSLSFCKISGSSQRDKIAAAAATDGEMVAAWVAVYYDVIVAGGVVYLSCQFINFTSTSMLCEPQTLFF